MDCLVLQKKIVQAEWKEFEEFFEITFADEKFLKMPKKMGQTMRIGSLKYKLTQKQIFGLIGAVTYAIWSHYFTKMCVLTELLI